MINLEDVDILYPDRSEIKQQINQLHSDIEDLISDIDIDKALLYSTYTFTSKSSDQKGRTLEFKRACFEHAGINQKESRLKSLQKDLRDKDKILSEINYDQRERMISAMSAVRQFTEAVKVFEASVDKLIDSRKKQ